MTRARFVAIALCFGANAAMAQDIPPTAWARPQESNGALADRLPSWLGAWSPLRPIVDAQRSLLRAPATPGLLDAPPPMIGAFVLAGAPGAFVRDFARDSGSAGGLPHFGHFYARSASEDGDYRRPLDVADSRVKQVGGFGWAPIGRRGMAIGRFVVDQEENDVSSFTARITPFSSTPIIMTDSVQPPMQRTRARLEGAVGAEVFGFGLGVSAALDSRENNSVDFPLRRSGRSALPGVAFGAERALPWYGLRIGVYGRWSEPNESNRLNPAPASTIIYQVQGYDEPFGFVVNATTPIFTRTDTRATATGGTIEASAFGASAVLMHESGSRNDEQTLAPFNANRAIERWRADGKETRLQVRRPIGARIVANVIAVTEESEGAGSRSDLTGIAFNGTDKREAIEADIRLTWNAAWSAAVIAGTVRTGHARNDYAAELWSDANAVSPFASVEVARRFARASVAAGLSFADRVPYGTSSIPNVEDRGANYNRIIAPSLAYEVSQARATAWWVTATAPFRESVLYASLRVEGTQSRAVDTARLAPSGERSGWSLSLGIRP